MDEFQETENLNFREKLENYKSVEQKDISKRSQRTHNTVLESVEISGKFVRLSQKKLSH